jgi:thioredoxin reductase (NADPH)
MTMDAPYDCLIVGGGPAGLTAAIYAARFRLKTLVVDGGGGRAASIPRTRNHAGFPGGVSGVELLDRMRRQAVENGAEIRQGRVTAIEGECERFSIRIGADVRLARAVILATGVFNHRPDIEPAAHDAMLARGLIRYCPVCDGFEVTDKAVGVIGSGARAVREAAFLRGYTARVTLIAPDGLESFSADERARLAELAVVVARGPGSLHAQGDQALVDTDTGPLAFDSVYPALGSTVHSQLAEALGAELTGDSCVRVDAHQRTSVPGLYAAGDVVIGLDQISHAMGEAGVAATTLRNDLAERRPLLRPAQAGG